LKEEIQRDEKEMNLFTFGNQNVLNHGDESVSLVRYD